MTVLVLLKVCFKVHLIPTPVSWCSPFCPQQWPPLARPSCHILPFHLKKLQTKGIVCFVQSHFKKNKKNTSSSLWKQQNKIHHLSFGQSLETVLDAVDLVAMNDCQPHCRPHRWVHPCSWSSHIQNGQGEIGLEEKTRPPSVIELKLCRRSVPGRVCSPQSGRAFGRQEVYKCSSCSQSSCTTVVQ